MDKVMQRVNEHYNRAVQHYGEAAVLGVFLYGSQNYGTNTPESDVDTKCILVPNLFSLAIKPYEVNHLDIDGEVCECMSIMHMVANWKKQNINFVEILFTDYCIINPLYQEVWANLMTLNNKEEIARYDIKAAVLSMAHQALHTLKQNPNDRKKIMNAARISYSLEKLTGKEPVGYKEVIRANESIANIRLRNDELPYGYVKLLQMYFVDLIKRAEDNEYTYEPHRHEAVNSFLNDVILDIISERVERIGC